MFTNHRRESNGKKMIQDKTISSEINSIIPISKDLKDDIFDNESINTSTKSEESNQSREITSIEDILRN